MSIPTNKEAAVTASKEYTPDLELGTLFIDVQLAQLFADSKTFVDAVPLEAPATILSAYEQERDQPDFSLIDFVRRHFLPPSKVDGKGIDSTRKMIPALKQHWSRLVCESRSDAVYHSLINLPHPFIVPGGRFREMFYWDSYFTIIGLLESGEDELVLSMIRNFVFLINEYGYIPNGNRTYFLTRSQPPFFAEMLRAYAEKKGMNAVIGFLPALEKEYRYWTKDDGQVNEQCQATGKSVWLNGAVLHRYTGGRTAPRAEAWNKEYKWAQALPEAQRPAFHREMRAACESGWDFSSRWFADPEDRLTCQCESLVPVCLNALLYNMEQFLARLHIHQHNAAAAMAYEDRAMARKAALAQYCWWEAEGIFTDYHFIQKAHNPVSSIAMVYPLFFGMATQAQADRVATVIRSRFLVEGGVVTTLVNSGEQWDAPNGWAPMQWLAVMGLDRYGHRELAREIATRWLRINEAVYEREHKMMEKYNVVDPSLPGGGGNYENQDGFGWTNGVALALDAWLKQIEKAGAEKS